MAVATKDPGLATAAMPPPAKLDHGGGAQLSGSGGDGGQTGQIDPLPALQPGQDPPHDELEEHLDREHPDGQLHRRSQGGGDAEQRRQHDGTDDEQRGGATSPTPRSTTIPLVRAVRWASSWWAEARPAMDRVMALAIPTSASDNQPFEAEKVCTNTQAAEGHAPRPWSSTGSVTSVTTISQPFPPPTPPC